MTRPRVPTRLALATLPVILALSLGGIAYAYSSGSGTGTGSATTGTTQDVTLGPGSAAGNLFPGGQTDVVLTMTNPNPSPVHIGSLTLATLQGTGGFAVDPSHPLCAVADAALSFTTPQTNGGNGWAVSASGALPVILPTALAMSLGAASACQDATFTVYVAAGP